MTEYNSKLCEHCSLPLPGGVGSGGRVMHEECKALTANLPRRCKKCKQVKVASHFSRDASRNTGRYPYCKDCQNKNQDKFQNEEDQPNGHICPVDDVPVRGHRNRRFCSTPCKTKVATLRRMYGMTIQDYRKLLEDANDHCPICKQRPTIWQVDHNHATLRSTGVVCINCNIGLLSHSGHSLERVQALLDYLTQTPCDRLGIEAIAPNEAPKSQLHRVWGRGRYVAKGTLGRNQYSKE